MHQFLTFLDTGKNDPARLFLYIPIANGPHSKQEYVDVDWEKGRSMYISVLENFNFSLSEKEIKKIGLKYHSKTISKPIVIKTKCKIIY